MPIAYLYVALVWVVVTVLRVPDHIGDLGPCAQNDPARLSKTLLPLRSGRSHHAGCGRGASRQRRRGTRLSRAARGFSGVGTCGAWEEACRSLLAHRPSNLGGRAGGADGGEALGVIGGLCYASGLRCFGARPNFTSRQASCLSFSPAWFSRSAARTGEN